MVEESKGGKWVNARFVGRWWNIRLAISSGGSGKEADGEVWIKVFRR